MNRKTKGFGTMTERRLQEKKFNQGEPVFWRLPYEEVSIPEYDLEKQEARIRAIVGVDIHGDIASVSPQTLVTYGNFIRENLVHPCYLTGSDDFGWEERFVFDHKLAKQHSEMRKTRASYLDTFRLIEVIIDLSNWHGLSTKVKRMEDGKIFELCLSELEATDHLSFNYYLLDDYSVWYCNYV